MARLPMVTGLALIALIHVTMSFSVQEYFPEINNNLTKIKWTHATNSQALLKEALNSNETQMIEADVLMGYEILGNGSTSPERVPIMAHTPDDKSDLTFSKFWEMVYDHNKKNNKTRKGIKLDFKNITAYQQVAMRVQKNVGTLQAPIFINADILKGPVNAEEPKVTAGEFLTNINGFSASEVVLSVGWTTKYVAPVGNATTSGNYTIEQINEMTKLWNTTKPKASITYPVRAVYAVNSLDVLKTLLANTPAQNNATLTIWSHKDDKVDAKKLSEFIRTIGVSKVFVDVPKSLLDQLDVSSAFTASSSVFMVFASLTIALFTAKLL